MPTLLLADDSLTVQRVIALTFAAEPIQVVAVNDGRQAMEKMAAARPDIVLAGTTLPHVDGYELAAYMRSKRELQNVPVLLLAGAFENVDEARLASSGAAGWIEKPVEPTTVIRRVKELLGLTSDASPSAAPGRLVTPAGGGDPKPQKSATLRAVTSTVGPPSKWEQLRDQSGLAANTKSVEDLSSRAGDYLGSLDDAFDTLDRQLSGRAPASRNPAGPIGQSGATADPRSPGRRPAAEGVSGNPVFEVDEEWICGQDATTRADRQEIAEDLRHADWRPAADGPPAASVYEVDESWFADGEKVRAARAEHEKQLADDMGIHDVDLPPREHDSAPPTVVESAGVAIDAPARVAPASPQPAVLAPAAPPATVADDFADLLAYEQGEKPTPSVAVMPQPEVRVITPAITTEMLDEIATRVADRLTAGPLAEALRDSMTSTVRETVRTVVSETSERLVREEIDRIKNKNI